MSEHSIIEHRAKYHYAKVEEDYIAICSHGECSPHCKALILSILEGWMNKKFADGEKSLYTYMTIPQWIDHTYRLYERNILIDCLAELAREELIKRNQITRYNQTTYEYILNTEVVQVLIRALPEKESVYPRLDAYLAFREKGNEKRRERKKAKEEQLKNQLPPIAVEKSTTPPLINNLPPLINQLNVSSYVSSPNVTSGEGVVTNTLPQPNADTHTSSISDDVSPDYTTSPTIEELSTQASDVSTDVHNPPSENGSQKSYSHKPATSAPSHVGMMPVMDVPMPPVMSEVVPAPPSIQVKPQAPFLRLVKKSDDPSDEAKAICALYEQVAGPGGFASWDWKAAEEMVKVHPTQADIQLIYDSLEGKKRNVEAIWLNWSTLATLKRNPPRKRPTGPVDSSYHPELETDETRAAREAKNKANMEKLDRRIAAQEQREREEAAKRKAI